MPPATSGIISMHRKNDAIIIVVISDSVLNPEDVSLLSAAALDFLLIQTRIRHSAFRISRSFPRRFSELSQEKSITVF